MAPRLKVFVTSDGLTDYIVAVSSKPKALAAWGAHQDLFKAGLAHEVDDPATVTAASARPGEVLRRPAGSRATLEKLSPARTRPTKPPKAEGPSQAQLRRIAAAEAKLAAIDTAHAAALAELEARRADLESRHKKARAKLEAALSAARRAPG